MRATQLILVGLAVAACGAMVAPAAIASAAESAELTIAELEAQGFDVEVNRIGVHPSVSASSPISEMSVSERNWCGMAMT